MTPEPCWQPRLIVAISGPFTYACCSGASALLCRLGFWGNRGGAVPRHNCHDCCAAAALRRSTSPALVALESRARGQVVVTSSTRR